MIENVKFGHSPLFYPAVLPALLRSDRNAQSRRYWPLAFCSFSLFFWGCWRIVAVRDGSENRTLRRKYPDRPRPYRMWGYPVMHWLFTVAFLIIASGISVYYL